MKMFLNNLRIEEIKNKREEKSSLLRNGSIIQ
jgi:hypothetical protein